MTLLARLRSFLDALLRRRRFEDEMTQEWQFHVASRAEALMAEGLSRAEAEGRARREFGDPLRWREQGRDVRGLRGLQDLGADARYAFRQMRRAPLFTVAVTTTLALGIGANTAIFSVVHALLLKPLPYPEDDRLVMVWQDWRARGGPEKEGATPGNFFDWQAESSVFASLAAVTPWRPTLTGMGDAETLVGEQVSHDYFDVTGIRPALGRPFRADEDRPDGARVVILNHGFWERRFGGDRAVIGRTMLLGGEAYEIVGVMPQGFRAVVATAPDVWRPLRLNAANPSRGAVILRVVGRLQPGLSVEQASAVTALLAARLEQTYPEWNTGAGISVVSLHEEVVGDIRLGLLVLLGAVGAVLLIACANIANLLLARASSRSREIALRLALGAGRPRLIRQLLTESVLLALIGGLIGLLVGFACVHALVALAPQDVPRLDEVRLDGMVLTFAVVVSVTTGVLFGLAPALQMSRGEIGTTLKEGARGAAGSAGSRTRRVLVAAEIAMALILLVGGGLLMRTFLHLQQADLGFEPSNVLVGTVLPSAAAYRTAEHRVVLYDRLLESAAALPGVQKAALSSEIPLSGGDADMGFLIDGRPEPRIDSDVPVAWYQLVSAGYLDTIGIPLRAGRGFRPREPMPSVIVNESLAARYWPGEDPLGQRIRFSHEAEAPWFTIVGVAGNVRFAGARDHARGEMYIPYWQFTELRMNIILKTAGTPEGVASALRQAVREIDADLSVTGVASMTRRLGQSIDEPRFVALLVGLFAALALLLSAVGIYGVLSYAVATRNQEIGVRVALGAERADIIRLVFGESLRMTAIGLLVGLAGAAFVTRYLRGLLFELTPLDPTTFIAVSVMLALVAALASYVPARQTTRVDPLVVLRSE